MYVRVLVLLLVLVCWFNFQSFVLGTVLDDNPLSEFYRCLFRTEQGLIDKKNDVITMICYFI